MVVAALVVVLAVVVFANSWGTFTTDTKPEVYLAPGRVVREYLSAWSSSPYLGAPSFNGGLVLVAGIVWLISSTGLSPELSFKVLHLAILLVAASGAAALGRRLDPRMGRRGALVVAIVFVANPYTVTAGATLPVLLPLAWLPWQLLVLVRAAEEPARWRWPALFGLTFFAMSGVNAGVVPVLCLLAMIPTLIYLRGTFGLSWRQVAVIVARCAFFAVWVSLYWLVPALAAAATGSTIVAGTESYDVIAGPSSFAEVLRGLGFWPLYGSDSGVPWVQAHAVYLTSVVVVTATFVAAALALLSLADVPRRLARYLATMVALSAVVMVGAHPVGSPSPVGRALLRGFEDVPLLSAFRTTNKIGAVLALAFALSAGAVLRRWWGNRRRPATRAVVLAAGSALVVLVALPAFSGHLYTSPVDVPGYWRSAANALDDDPSADRVMVLPGSVTPDYRWSAQRPDDIVNSLFERPTFTPVTVANTSAEGVNLTAALDDTFQSATAQGPFVSTFARYVGAGDLLVRHDTVWEKAGGTRPGQAQRTVAADSGLVPVQNFGRPGQNVTSPTVEPEPIVETDVPPLQHYRIADPVRRVRAAPAGSQLVVAGDGWSVPAMARSGLLTASPAFRYARDLDDAAWQDVLGAGHRIVLTDTNRRRSVIAQRLVDGQGPLLRADQPLPAATRTLGTDAADQTVLRVDGGRVTASRRGYAFFDTPWGTAENAFDGDPQSAWIPGDYGRARGQHVQLDLADRRDVGSVQILQSAQGPVRIDRVTVRAGDVSRTVRLAATGATTVDLSASDVASVRVTIDSLAGSGVNSPGIAEVVVPGARIDRVAELPRTLEVAYSGWSSRERAAFSDTPLDVLLSRAQGGQGPQDDEEQSLERSFVLPDDRSFGAAAWVRLDSTAEGLYDRVEGIEGGATSSGQWFDRPDLRASRAFDGDPTTGWAPNVTAGSKLSLRDVDRDVATVRFDQRILPGGFETSWARRVEVRSDGRLLTTAKVAPGSNRIRLTDDGSTVPVGDLEIRVVAADPEGPGITPPLVTRVDVGRTLQSRSPRCIDVVSVDGTPLRMRPVADASPQGSAWRGCGGPVDLAAGPHEVRSTGYVKVVDSLDLTDTRRTGDDTQAAPTLRVERGRADSMTVTPSRSDVPYILSIGEGFDDRWHASIGGRSLGRPIVVDGFSTGWLVEPSDGDGPISITFGPQRAADVALATSGAGVLVVGVLAGLPWARRRSRRLDVVLARGRRAAGALLRRPRGTSAAGDRPGRLETGRGAGARQWLTTSRARGWTGWSAVVVAGWVLASWPGLVAGLVLAVVHLAGAAAGRQPSPRALIGLGASAVVLAGLVWLVAIADELGTVTPALVEDHPWPNALAAAGLLAVVVGVWRRHDEP
jgi:arabinofuranan 3-O-arabinosyltransferase